MEKLSSSLIALTLLCAGASAVTVFDNHDSTDSYLSNSNNWDNGLPSAANPGTISTNAKCGNNTLTDFVVTQTAGDITMGGYPQTSIAFSGGSWTMNGGSIVCRAHTYKDGAVFTLNHGTLTTRNNSHVQVWGTGSRLIVNGGIINADRNMFLRSGGDFTINGGTVIQDPADAFGAPGYQGSGTMNFNGGTVSGGRFTFQGTTSATFGGSAAGSATFMNWGNDDNSDRHKDRVILINFLSGTQVSLTIDSGARALDLTNDGIDNPTTDPWAKALWDHDQLLFDGQSSHDLGKTWSEATSTGGLGNNACFEFDGTTLWLVKAAATVLLVR